jgi:hypothetical protein
MVRLISRLGSEDLFPQSRRKQIISVASIGKELSQEGFLGVAAWAATSRAEKTGPLALESNFAMALESWTK